MRYLAVVERDETSWCAHVLDPQRCVAVGDTREEVVKLIAEPIDLHIESLREPGERVRKAS